MSLVGTLTATAQEAKKEEEKAGFKLQCPKGKTSSSPPSMAHTHTHTSHCALWVWFVKNPPK